MSIMVSIERKIDFSLMEEIRKKTSDFGISFYNFTNIFMWQDAMRYTACEICGCICIFARYRENPPFMMWPIGDNPIGAIKAVLCERGSIILRPLSEDMVQSLKTAFPSASFEENPDLSDYIYNACDLDTLVGRKFHSKRNHIAKFNAKYSYEYISITEENLGILQAAAKKLFTSPDDDELCDEYIAINRTIDNFSRLGVKAGVITVDENPVAYSIGEMMSDNTVLIHIEKADRDFDGAYSVINREFLRHEFMTLPNPPTYVNREEDMGKEGLIKAKMSYCPIGKTPIFSAEI